MLHLFIFITQTNHVTGLFASVLSITTKSTVISPDFPVWEFCGKAQFPPIFGRIARNYAETVPFRKTYVK